MRIALLTLCVSFAASACIVDAQPTPGETGPPGSDGANGKDGINGVDGEDGSDGAPGADGQDGMDGLPGEPGDEGVPGPPGVSPFAFVDPVTMTDIYYDAGRVAIGTTIPNAQLTVGGTGDIRLDGPSSWSLSTSFGLTSFEISDTTARRAVFDKNGSVFLGGSIGNSAGADALFSILAAGNVGIGTTTPTGKLHIYSGSAGSVTANPTGNDIVIENNTYAGLSILTPEDVSSQIYFGSPSYAAASYVQYQHDNLTPLFAVSTNIAGGELVFGSGVGSERMRIAAGGNVGVGTSTPQSVGGYPRTLVISGPEASISLQATGVPPTHTWELGAQNNGKFYFGQENIARMVIDASGNVGIGTHTPSQRLHVNGDIVAGNILASGTITGDLIDTSSRQVKQDVRELGGDDAVRAFQALRPVHFRYRAAPDEEQLGFIAEDVPDLVATNNREGVAPMDIAAVLTRVVQMQDATIRKQQQVIDQQQRRIDEAIARIEKLERRPHVH